MKATSSTSTRLAPRRATPQLSAGACTRIWSVAEREQLQKFGNPVLAGFDKRMIEESVAVSSDPEWRRHLAERYLETHPARAGETLDAKRDFAETVGGFGPVAQAGVARCLGWLSEDLPAMDPGDDPDAATRRQVHAAAIRAALSSGNRSQVCEAIPAYADRLIDPGYHNLPEQGITLGERINRLQGADHAAVVATLRAQIADQVTDGLDAREMVIGRALMSLGDDHPAALAWVRAQVTGTLPPRRDMAYQPSGRIDHLLTWCESTLERGGAIDPETARTVMPMLMRLATDSGDPRSRARAATVIGSHAARLS